MAALVGRFLGLVVGAAVVMATAAGGGVNRLLEDGTTRTQENGTTRTLE
jgi:hypothetical protein